MHMHEHADTYTYTYTDTYTDMYTYTYTLITRSNEKYASLHPFPDNWWCTGVPLEDGRSFRIQDDTSMFWEVF